MLRGVEASTLVAIRVRPRSRRAALLGEREGRLVVEVTTPPADGRANAAACRLIAEAIGVGRTRVTVVSGARAREKVVRVEGVDPDELAARLGVSAPGR